MSPLEKLGHLVCVEIQGLQMTEDAVSVGAAAVFQYIAKLCCDMIDGRLCSSYMELGGRVAVSLFQSNYTGNVPEHPKLVRP